MRLLFNLITLLFIAIGIGQYFYVNQEIVVPENLCESCDGAYLQDLRGFPLKETQRDNNYYVLHINAIMWISPALVLQLLKRLDMFKKLEHE